MADYFKARFLAQMQPGEEKAFQVLVDQVQNVSDTEDLYSFDIDALNYFDSRTMMPDDPFEFSIGEGSVEFSLILPYGINLESLRDFSQDFGIAKLYCLFAHEREELQWWEFNGEEHKTIGIVKIERIDDGDGWYDSEMSFVYPAEENPVRISQFWRLAWNGSWTHEGSMEEFFNQNGDDITIAAHSGIHIAESEGDDEGREMSLGEIVGEKPIDAPYGFCGAKDFAWKPISTEDFE